MVNVFVSVYRFCSATDTCSSSICCTKVPNYVSPVIEIFIRLSISSMFWLVSLPYSMWRCVRRWEEWDTWFPHMPCTSYWVYNNIPQELGLGYFAYMPCPCLCMFSRYGDFPSVHVCDKGEQRKLESTSIINQEQTPKCRVHWDPKIFNPTKRYWEDPSKEVEQQHPETQQRK